MVGNVTSIVSGIRSSRTEGFLAFSVMDADADVEDSEPVLDSVSEVLSEEEPLPNKPFSLPNPK